MRRGKFAAAVTRGLHAEVTLHTRRAWAAQMQAEGGSARNNPFNTTMPMPGATNFNSAGVKNYVSPQQGIEATIKTLKGRGHGYEKILQLLRANASAVQIVTAIGQSDWGTESKLALEVLDEIKRGVQNLSELEAREIAS